MVKSYSDTVTELLSALRTAKATIGVQSDEHIQEVGDYAEFGDVPTPFVYVAFDIGQSKSQQGYLIEMVIDCFIVYEAADPGTAKTGAVGVAVNVLDTLRDNYCMIKDDFIEMFSTFSNRCVIRCRAYREATLVNTVS